MSKHETWRTRKFWQSIGGLLIEEFVAVKGDANTGRRPVDGVIVLGGETKIYEGTDYDLSGKDVIVIQTKRDRIGMYLLGQAYFSKFLIEMHQPRSIRSVAICGRGDSVMERLAKEHDVEIVVIPESEKPLHVDQ